MIKLNGKVIEECGWAGPLLWVCTKDNYAIHFYDAPIYLNKTRISTPRDINLKLTGKRITSVSADPKNFSVHFSSGLVLKVNHSEVETARVFKRGGKVPHWVYKSGTLSNDRDA